MSVPGIILTSKYTLPDSKSFNNYVNYLTREKALLEKEQLKLTEENELLRISSARKTLFDNVYNGLDVKESSDDIKHKIQDEANKVLDNKFDFDVMSNQDYTKMVSYMARSYALERKKTRTPAEQSELERVKSAMMDSQKVAKKNDGILNGVFNQSADFVRFGDLDDVKDRFVEAQNNGSVLYQDVISFDNKFLMKQGLLDRKGNLNEDRLKSASKEMMGTLFESESLDKTGYWFASIHRNTKHVHIHFATIESQNTRKIVEVMHDGSMWKEPKGKRRQATLDKMKTSFANNLLDRSEQLKRISQLRNTLVEDIRDSFNSENKKSLALVQDIYKSLPDDRKSWNFGSENNHKKNQISPEARAKVNKLTSNLIRDNPNYKEYRALVKKESSFNKSVYGESNRNDRDYQINKMKDIQKRLGNSVLKELKKFDSYGKSNFEKLNGQKQLENKVNYKPKFTPQLLYRIRKNITDVDHYRNEQVYLQMQQNVDRELN